MQVAYDLQAVILHSGSAQQGHYKTLPLYGSQWMCCNDDSVSIHTFNLRNTKLCYSVSLVLIVHTNV